MGENAKMLMVVMVAATVAIVSSKPPLLTVFGSGAPVGSGVLLGNGAPAGNGAGDENEATKAKKIIDKLQLTATQLASIKTDIPKAIQDAANDADAVKAVKKAIKNILTNAQIKVIKANQERLKKALENGDQLGPLAAYKDVLLQVIDKIDN
uniref:Secreted protein n=1 Tax=Plectus sambesii TaxID=2011161 RepID=A0A914VI68_9BILA